MEAPLPGSPRSGDTARSGKIRPVPTLIFLIGLQLILQLVWSPVIRLQQIDGVRDVGAVQLMPPNREPIQRQTKQNDNVVVAQEVAENSQSVMEPVAQQLEAFDLPVYTREMAAQAIRPAPWTCGDRDEVATDPLSEEKPIFAFVHVYKAAGSTIRTFFNKYAAICRKSWMVLVSCTEVESFSIQSDVNWKKCRVKEVVDGRKQIHYHESRKKRMLYPTVNNTVILENVDIIGGHMRIGTGDSIFGNTVGESVPPVRHIVFLRDPKTRFVSGILYQINKDTKEGEGRKQMEDIVKMIKKRIRGSRKSNDYWGASFSYLLTPSQAENAGNMGAGLKPTTLSPEERRAEAKARAAIQNLVHYNVIMGMAEKMSQSMQILKHALVSGKFTSEDRSEWVTELFDEYIADESEENGNVNSTKKDVRRNVSERDGGVSTASVLEELRKDAEFMPIFDEYVKYEQMITDFALKMHLLQHKIVMEK